MSLQLAQKECLPCKGGVPPLPKDKTDELLRELDGWSIEQEYHLTKTFRLPDFVAGLEFVNRIGAIAEKQNHHPDVYLAWGTVRLEVWTHKIKGLTESDFIYAAKADAAFAQCKVTSS